MKTLSLIKGAEQFYFRYETGDEEQVLAAMLAMVNRRELNFDRFDAAVLSHQLGRHLAKEIRHVMPTKLA